MEEDNAKGNLSARIAGLSEYAKSEDAQSHERIVPQSKIAENARIAHILSCIREVATGNEFFSTMDVLGLVKLEPLYKESTALGISSGFFVAKRENVCIRADGIPDPKKAGKIIKKPDMWRSLICEKIDLYVACNRLPKEWWTAYHTFSIACRMNGRSVQTNTQTDIDKVLAECNYLTRGDKKPLPIPTLDELTEATESVQVPTYMK